MTPIIWHNPRCSKSRAALALLQEAGHAPEIRRYLDAPPNLQELSDLLDKLRCPPGALVRRGEAVFRDLGLADKSDEDLRAAMVAHPILIERPVVILGPRAVIGRPPEKVMSLFA